MILKFYNCKNIILLLLLLFFITQVFGECQFKYPETPLLKPRFTKKIGSRYSEISNTHNDYLTIQSDEEIIAHCDIQFEEPNNYNNFNKLNIKCDGIDININGRFHTNRILPLECASLKWNLYEISKPFKWCPSDMASYILSRPTEEEEDEKTNHRILAKICYDTDNMSLKSLLFTMSPKHMTPWPKPPPISQADYSKSMEEIKYIKTTFTSKSINFDNYDNQQFRNWMEFANYQFNSTIQNSILYNEVYNEFGSLLDIAWWPNLRLGNWKRYEEALARQVENKNTSYHILAGISGAVMAPVQENCQNNFTMKELIDGENQKLPLYVWNYLQPTVGQQSGDEVVVIGVNSPFYEFHSENEFVFCQDICNKIDWLENVRSTFRYSTMGVVFCCSIEEVKSSKRLNGFPENINEKLFNFNTSQPPIPIFIHF